MAPDPPSDVAAPTPTAPTAAASPERLPTLPRPARAKYLAPARERPVPAEVSNCGLLEVAHDPIDVLGRVDSAYRSLVGVAGLGASAGAAEPARRGYRERYVCVR